MSQDDKVANFTVQLFKITIGKDGGGRIQLDFGADALEEIQKIQLANGKGGCNFILALAPYKNKGLEPNEYGEIQL